MRKVKVGAIQSGRIPWPPECSVFSDSYIGDAEYIFNSNTLGQLDITLDLLRQAGEDGCDIVVTSEDICANSAYLIDTSEQNIFPRLVDISSRHAEKEIASIAAAYGMYVIACYYKPYGDGIYNVASVFSRSGEIIAEYRKTHLPPNEKWQLKEGDSLDVIELDFGKIGILICYDIMFPEAAEVLSQKGAEIIFHPTAGYGWYDEIGEATLKTRANDGGFYIVTAKNYRYAGAGKSSVIDFWGQSLADAGFYENVIVTKQLDLDFEKTQPSWFNPTPMSGIANVRKRRAVERRPELYNVLTAPIENKLTAPDPERQRELYQMEKDGSCHW